jgi:hypothetical protein
MMEMRLMGINHIRPSTVGLEYGKPYALAVVVMKAIEFAAKRQPWGSPKYDIRRINTTHYLIDQDFLDAVDFRITEYECIVETCKTRLEEGNLPLLKEEGVRKAIVLITESMPFIKEYQETWHAFMEPA